MSSNEPTQRPTRGQQRILQLCCRVSHRLRGHRAVVRDEVAYRIVELQTTGLPPREVMMVTRPMVSSLLAAGWLGMLKVGNRRDFELRVTEAGIAAANGPTREG